MTQMVKASYGWNTSTSRGPIPAIHSVVRWRSKDLAPWIYEEFGISLDETTTRADIETLWALFVPAGVAMPRFEVLAADAAPMIPEALRRTSAFLTHPVFNTHRSETAMLR